MFLLLSMFLLFSHGSYADNFKKTTVYMDCQLLEQQKSSPQELHASFNVMSIGLTD